MDVYAATGKTVTVTVPTDPPAEYDLMEDSDPGSYEYYIETFGGLSGLDATYPQGDYVLRVYADAEKTTLEETLVVSFGNGDPMPFPEVFPGLTQPAPVDYQLHAGTEQTYVWNAYGGATGTATHVGLEITGTGEEDGDFAIYDVAIDEANSYAPHLDGQAVPAGAYDLELCFYFRQSSQEPGGPQIDCANERYSRYALTVETPVYQPSFTYATNNGTITITGYAGPGGDVVIPDTINGLPVTDIGLDGDVAGAFQNSTNITSVVIPDSVLRIGSKAFYYCLGLTNVVLGANVESVGSEAFGLCFDLKKVDLPDSLHTVGQSAFYLCNQLSTMDLPASCTNLGDAAFMYCTALTEVELPDGLSSIPFQLFHSCSGLTNVVIPASVTSIAQGAFSFCTALPSVDLPDGLVSIGDSAFSYCSKLANIVLPDGLSFIGSSAFGSCYTLAEIAIPGSVSSIGEGAFAQCSALSSVTISNGVETIAAYAFSSCGSLTNLAIPASVVSIGNGVFSLCTALAAFDVAESNSVYSSHEGVLYNKESSSLILCPEGKSGVYAMLPGTSFVADYAFGNCTLLAEVEVPDSVVLLGTGVFGGCSGLTNAVLGSGISRLPESAFSGTGLASITLPTNIVELADAAFFQCTALTNIALDGVSNIGPRVFQNCTALQSIDLPAGLVALGGEAFKGCVALQSIEIPEGVTHLGWALFDRCSSLSSVTLPSTLSSIDAWAFSQCANLVSITIPAGVASIGDYAFSYCPSLESVYFLGDAPVAGSEIFAGSEGATIYHLEDVAGWDAVFGGRPTAVWIPEYQLTVNNGTGSGSYTNGQVVAIAANAAPFGHVFNRWTGATQYVANVASPSTSVTMPAQDISVSSTYMADPAADFTYVTNNGTITITGYTGPGGDVAIPSAINGLPVVSIGNNVFFYNTSLTGISIPDSVVSIGAGAFKMCYYLTHCTLSGSLESIGNEAFSNCARLGAIYIPASTTSIGYMAFLQCRVMTAITVDGENPNYCSHEGILLDKGKTTIIQCPGGKSGTYAAPDSVTSVGNYAFDYAGVSEVVLSTNVIGIGYAAFNSSGLSSMVLPESVRGIGGFAFGSCLGLKSITVPSGITSISDNTFWNCVNLTNVVFKGNVTGIGRGTFYNCHNLKAVVIPAGLAGIGNEAFARCYALDALYFSGNAPSLGTGVFDQSSKLTVYRLAGANGWPPVPDLWGGRPTALWESLFDSVSILRSLEVDGPALFEVDVTAPTGKTVTVAVPTDPETVYDLTEDGVGKYEYFDNTLSNALASLDTQYPQGNYVLRIYSDAGKTHLEETLTVSFADETDNPLPFPEVYPALTQPAPVGWNVNAATDQTYAWATYSGATGTATHMNFEITGSGETDEDFAIYGAEITGPCSFAPHLEGQPVPAGEHDLELCYSFRQSAQSPLGTLIECANERYSRYSLTVATPSYQLTVNGGTGSGSYTNGQVVAITANAAPSGQMFDQWIGATQYVANVTASSTSVTMPAQDVSVSATYKSASSVLVEDLFGGVSGALPDASKFVWSGEVTQNGSGLLDLQTWSVNTSWIRSKVGASPGTGETLTLRMRAAAYAEGWNPGIYGDMQPRGLRVGTDANNAIEFYSASRVSVGMRVVKDGIGSSSTYSLPAGVNSMHDYEISVTPTSVVFRIDGAVAGEFTANIPTGSLNFHASTYDGGFGNVPAQIDSMSLILSGNGNPDADEDGLPDSWERQYFGGTGVSPSAICSNSVNTVLEAYVAGFDPTDPQALFAVNMAGPNILEWSGVTGRVYSVWWSTNLMNGFSCLSSNIPWSAESFTDTVHSVHAKGFYQLDVRME